MSIVLKTLYEDGVGTEAKMIAITTQEDWNDFKELVFRAMNLWPDAPASLKRFSDMVQHGKVLQDYKDSTTRHKLFEERKQDQWQCLLCRSLVPGIHTVLDDKVTPCPNKGNQNGN